MVALRRRLQKEDFVYIELDHYIAVSSTYYLILDQTEGVSIQKECFIVN